MPLPSMVAPAAPTDTGAAPAAEVCDLQINLYCHWGYLFAESFKVSF